MVPPPVAAPPVTPEEMSVEAIIENKSPWPVKEFEAVVQYRGKLFALGTPVAAGNAVVELAEPLAVGKTTSVTTTARFPAQRPAPGVYAADFVTGEQ